MLGKKEAHPHSSPTFYSQISDLPSEEIGSPFGTKLDESKTRTERSTFRKRNKTDSKSDTFIIQLLKIRPEARKQSKILRTFLAQNNKT